MHHRSLGRMAVAAGLAVLSAFSSVLGGHSGDSQDIPAPPGLPSFYSVPQPLPSGPAGTLIKYEAVPDANLVGATLYRVMYKSVGPRRSLVPVTGMVLVPTGHRPPEGGPW